jgi:hypothetical protein
VVQYYNRSVVVQVYQVTTGVLQGYRSSRVVYRFFCITWLQKLYTFTVVVQYCRGPGIAQRYRCSGVVQGYTATGVILLYRGSTGV